jgi:hypothetical protein
MSDFLRLKVLERHYLLEIDVKRRKLGLPVSQHLPNMFPHSTAPASAALTDHMVLCDMQESGWILFVLLWRNMKRLTCIWDSE